MTGDGPHILVVDDDRRLRELLRRFLSDNGFLVSTAGDAAEARRLLDGMAVDLIILDVMMPGEDGLAFTASLRTHSHVPILLLTARGEVEDRIDGLERGADETPVAGLMQERGGSRSRTGSRTGRRLCCRSTTRASSPSAVRASSGRSTAAARRRRAR